MYLTGINFISKEDVRLIRLTNQVFTVYATQNAVRVLVVIVFVVQPSASSVVTSSRRRCFAACILYLLSGTLLLLLFKFIEPGDDARRPHSHTKHVRKHKYEEAGQHTIQAQHSWRCIIILQTLCSHMFICLLYMYE